MISAIQKKKFVMRHFNFSVPRHINLFHKFIKHVIKMKKINNDIEEYKKDRTLPHTYLLTTSLQMNNIMPNVTLDALGLNPVIKMP